MKNTDKKINNDLDLSQKIILSNLRHNNIQWFSAKKFFNDIDYKIFYSKISKKPFLVRSTYSFSEMFNGKKEISWRINPLDHYKILPLVETIFNSLESAKNYLNNI